MDLTSIGSFFVFVLVLSVLVFVHEFGHFITAKRLGIHIEEFGFGVPPRLIGVVRDAKGQLRLVKGQNVPKPAALGGRRTIYSTNAIRLCGFVGRLATADPLAPGAPP